MAQNEDDLVDVPVMEIDHLSCIQVTLFKKVYTLCPAEDLRISVGQLGEHLQTQPSKYAFYATLKDMATHKRDRASDKYHQTRAYWDAEFRKDGFLPDGMGKITEDGLRRCINLKEEVKDAEKEMRKAEVELALLTSVVRAFEQRRDCLVALSTRQNSGVFHDRDVDATVRVDVTVATPIQKLKQAAGGAGAHPSKAKK